MEPKLIFLGAVVGYTLLAAVFDFRTRKIPNYLTVPAFIAGLVFHLYAGGWAGLASALGGFAVGFTVLFALWLVGGGGAGDAKLMGALGAWLGWWNTLLVFIASTGFVLLITIVVLTWQALRYGGGYVTKRYVRGPNGKRKEITEEEYRAWRYRRRVMPYAFPVALGTWLVLALRFQELL